MEPKEKGSNPVTFAKSKSRRGYSSLQAVDPTDGQLCPLLISHHRMDQIAKRGTGASKELAFVVPWVLLHPTAIFQGVREDAEGEWVCYCGVPPRAYENKSGAAREPWPNEVYLVFATDEGVIYCNRWDDCDPENPKLPVDHDRRFSKRLL